MTITNHGIKYGKRRGGGEGARKRKEGVGGLDFKCVFIAIMRGKKRKSLTIISAWFSFVSQTAATSLFNIYGMVYDNVSDMYINSV